MKKISYEVLSFNYSRNDGLVEVRINPKSFKKETVENSNEIKYQLLKEKYRCLKSEIQDLKYLLKRSYTAREFKEFYRIYGPKLIEIDFGFIELFNVKGVNQFSIQDIEQFKKGTNLIRWGKLFKIAQLENYKDASSVQDQITGLQFYNMLARERIFTLRTLQYYKNDVERKKFPYQYLYIYDLEDNIQICLSYFKELPQQFQENVVKKTNQFGEQLSSLKKKFFQQKFQNFKLQNIIVPFIQYISDEEQTQIQLFFMHFSLNGYQIKKYSNKFDDELEKNKQNRFKCYIFVNYDTTFYNHEELVNGAIKFASDHDFSISESDVLFININTQESSFLEEYVNYIESEFFLPENSIEGQMNYIFKQLPKELSTKSFNSILDEKLILPQNIQNVIKNLSGEIKMKPIIYSQQ